MHEGIMQRRLTTQRAPVLAAKATGYEPRRDQPQQRAVKSQDNKPEAPMVTADSNKSEPFTETADHSGVRHGRRLICHDHSQDERRRGVDVPLSRNGRRQTFHA